MTVSCVLCAAAVLTAAQADAPALPHPAVVGPKAGESERYAADQLCDYFARPYGTHVRPSMSVPRSADLALLVESPETNPAVAAAPGNRLEFGIGYLDTIEELR